MFSAYATLFRIPGALRFSFAGFIGRMPISMDNLALIFIVVDATGSYALAGALTAVSSITFAIASPIWARSADRVGQSKIIAIATPVRILFFLLLVFLVSKDAPTWTWFACVVISEAHVINAGGMVRRRWLHILKSDPAMTEKHLVNTAYSFEALIDEIIFIAGPVIATYCATRIAPSAGIIASVIFVTLGLPALAAMKSTEPPAIPKNKTEPHPPVLRNKKVQSIVIPCIMIGGYFGSVAISVVAFTQERNAQGISGLLLAIWAVGSAISAIATGVIKWEMSHEARFLIFALGLFLASIPFLFTHSIFSLTLALFVNGLFIAPLIVNAYGVAENAVPAGQITETLAWVVAGMPIGGAISSSAAGWVIEHHGANAALWIPGIFMLAALLATLPYLSTFKAGIGYAQPRD